MAIKRTRERSYIRKKEKKSNESWGSNSKFYQTKAWREKSKHYRKKHPSCKMCEEMGIERQADVTDHIEPVPPNATIAEFWAMSKNSNLQPLCERHHNQKTNIDNK